MHYLLQNAVIRRYSLLISDNDSVQSHGPTSISDLPLSVVDTRTSRLSAMETWDVVLYVVIELTT